MKCHVSFENGHSPPFHPHASIFLPLLSLLPFPSCHCQYHHCLSLSHSIWPSPDLAAIFIFKFQLTFHVFLWSQTIWQAFQQLYYLTIGRSEYIQSIPLYSPFLEFYNQGVREDFELSWRKMSSR